MSEVVIIMGVSGCGKSTIGKNLAEAGGRIYIEGDELHPKSNIEKMSSGRPLCDDDRWPWFDHIIAEVKNHQSEHEMILVGCSALKQSYRDYLCSQFGDQWKIIHLEGSFDTILKRMESRQHFMPPELLKSQFETLEKPNYSSEKLLTLAIDQPVEEMVKKAENWLG